jgi:hypothetical protein
MFADGENFYLFDKKSKFGTQILGGKMVKIDQNAKYFQIGNIYVSLFMKVNSQTYVTIIYFYKKKFSFFDTSTNFSLKKFVEKDDKVIISNDKGKVYFSEKYESVLNQIQNLSCSEK